MDVILRKQYLVGFNHFSNSMDFVRGIRAIPNILYSELVLYYKATVQLNLPYLYCDENILEFEIITGNSLGALETTANFSSEK